MKNFRGMSSLRISEILPVHGPAAHHLKQLFVVPGKNAVLGPDKGKIVGYVKIFQRNFFQPAGGQFLSDRPFIEKGNAAPGGCQRFDGADAADFQKIFIISKLEVAAFQITLKNFSGAGTGLTDDEPLAERILDFFISRAEA